MTTPVGVTRHTGVSSRRYKGVETGRVWNLPDDVIGLVYQCTFFLSSIFFPYHNQIKIEKIPIGMRWSIPIPPFFSYQSFFTVYSTHCFWFISFKHLSFSLVLLKYFTIFSMTSVDRLTSLLSYR